MKKFTFIVALLWGLNCLAADTATTGTTKAPAERVSVELLSNQDYGSGPVVIGSQQKLLGIAALKNAGFAQICKNRELKARLELPGETVIATRFAVQRNDDGYTWFGILDDRLGHVVLTIAAGVFQGTVFVNDRVFAMSETEPVHVRRGFDLDQAEGLRKIRITEVAQTGLSPGEEFNDAINLDTAVIRQLPRDGRYRTEMWQPDSDEEGLLSSFRHDYTIGRIPPEAEKLGPQYDGYKLMKDDSSVIDIMVVVMDQALAYAGSEPQVDANMQHVVDQANISFLQSGVDTWLNMVSLRYTSTALPANPGLALDALENPTDGVLDEIHDWRDMDAADLMVVITGSDALDEVAGVARALRKSAATNVSSEVAFALYEADNVWQSTTLFAHEIGHLLGISHDWYVDYDRQQNEPPFDPLDFELDAHGFLTPRITPLGAETRRYYTVMAYRSECSEDLGSPPNQGFDPCVKLPYFSNPNIYLPFNVIANDGLSPDSYYALGRALPELDAADAVRVINSNIKNVAQYRLSGCRTFPTHPWCP